jgi:hypothetical protein
MSSSTNYLLVPITVEALVVGQTDLKDSWFTAGMDYTKWADLLDPDPGPANSAPDWSPAAEGGIHLHWALPDALTHGFQNTDGSIEFPCIPNRWLVVRLTDASPQAWMIESDYLDEQLGSNSYPKPDQPGVSTRLGRSVPADQWTEPGSKPWLTAVGPGDMTFTAFYPKVRNVLGFHDTSDQLKDVSQRLLAYQVFGWYSDPSGDPLSMDPRAGNDRQWLRFIEHCNWSVNGQPLKEFFAETSSESSIPLDGSPGPSRILCHGLIQSVPWNGFDGQGYVDPAPSSIHVAAGNTAAEAIAALIETRINSSPDRSDPSQAIGRLLDAMQYQLLNRPGEQNGSYERTIHAARFAAHPGGSYWLVTTKPDQPPLSGSPHEPDLTASQQDLLRELNEAQRQSDALRRQYTSLQRELYTLWWKSRSDKSSTSGTHYDDLIAKVTGELSELLKEIDENSTASKKKQLADSLSTTEFELENKTMPPFWQANDPVILVEGAGRSYKHGEDGRYSETNELLCRRVGQTIGAIDLRVGEKIIPVRSPDSNLVIPAPDQAVDAIRALMSEAFLLDPNNAQKLAGMAQRTENATIDPQQVAKQQTLIWNAALYPHVFDSQALQDLSGFNGTTPSPVSVEQWRSPWSPIYLDWIVSWVPGPQYPNPGTPISQDPKDGVDILKQSLHDWWSLREHEYEYTIPPESPPASVPAIQSPAVLFKGRTLLTPQVTLGLQTSLEALLGGAAQDSQTDLETAEQYLDSGGQPADIVQLPDLIAAVKDWDVLSQALSSFTDLLTQRQPALLPPPNDPKIAELMKQLDQTPLSRIMAIPQPTSPYLPIRAGRLSINQLYIVDSFGHAADLGSVNILTSRDGSFVPRDPKLDDANSLYLPPRLSQPARLLLKMISAEEDQLDILTDPGANPICGWVVPIFLDQVVAIFDAQGKALGQLAMLMEHSPEVYWDPAPGTDGIAEPRSIKNAHLRRFVLSLLEAGKRDGNVLNQLLQLIDDTSWAIDPEDEKGNEAMTVLFGQPLAVVRAELQLELDGNPVYDLQWRATASRNETHDWTDVNFPVRLGNLERGTDGLIGFFSDDFLKDSPDELYQRFHAVFPKGDESTNDFITDDHFVQVQPQSSLHGALPPGKMLTLLLDPCGGVEVVSGILPTQHITLPAHYLQKALGAMQVPFRIGPLLGDAKGVRIPFPAQSRGHWALFHRTNPTEWQENASIIKSDDRARLGDAPLQIIEGRLKLSGESGADSKTDIVE